MSEHIWCEDYLVRSFYLKNLRTNETRTVTQFHFLSWPDDSVPANIKPLLEFRRYDITHVWSLIVVLVVDQLAGNILALRARVGSPSFLWMQFGTADVIA